MELTSGNKERSSNRLLVQLARTDDDVRAAQRLRYEVFAGELTARLGDGAGGIDEDGFDRFCDHLLVRSGDGEVIGTYRILRPAGACQAGGYYSETEFDLSRLRLLGSQMIEVGRACVRKDHRDGRVIGRLWSGLLRYIVEGGFRYVVGCASIEARDGLGRAESACRHLLANHLAPHPWRVFPWHPFAVPDSAPPDESAVPSLIQGYLRLGAVVCGEPAWDPDFRCADVLMLLPVERINVRYVERLLRLA